MAEKLRTCDNSSAIVCTNIPKLRKDVIKSNDNVCNNTMSNDSVNRSLAPDGAEDDSLRGTQSVPAILKLSKDLLGRHLTVLGKVVDHFSVEDKLSTSRPSTCMQIVKPW